MATKLDKRSHQWRLGQGGETEARQWLREAGYAVLPSMLIDNGGAPLLERALVSLVLPDMIMCKSGTSVLVDVKTKSRPDPNHKRGGMESDAISLRHYHNYLAVGREMGMRVAILFIHAERQEMLLGYLDEVSGPEDSWVIRGPFPPNHAYKEDMIFFNVDANRGTKFILCETGEDFAGSLAPMVNPSKAIHVGPRDVRKGDRWLPWHSGIN